MLCDKCGQNEATVHLCEIHRGLPSEMHICGSCADMFLPIERGDVAELLEQLPPRGTLLPRDMIYLEGEPGPEPGEVEMTAVGQHILVAEVETGRMREVTDPTARSSGPWWSPDSGLIAHRVFPGERGGVLRICSPEGVERQRFHGVMPWSDQGLWTSDSREVCFSWISGESGVSHPVLADVHTGETHATLKETDLSTVWAVPAPDGKRLAVQVQERGAKAGEHNWLMVINRDGGRRRKLVDEGTRLVMPMSWSADGEMLAVMVAEVLTAEEGDELGLPRLGEMRVDVVEVAGGRKVFACEGADRCCWSPDGRQLLLAAQEEGSWALKRAERGRWGEPERIGRDVQLPGSHLSRGQWSSDGKRVAYQAGPEGLVYVTGLKEPLPIEGVTNVGWRPGSEELGLLVGHEVMLMRPGKAGSQRVVLSVPREEYFDVVGMYWSPDGRMVAIEAHSAESR